MTTKREVGPTGLALWQLPGSVFQIMWAGPGSRLLFGLLTTPSGAFTTIKHPTADGVYDTLREATEAVERFVAATLP